MLVVFLFSYIQIKLNANDSLNMQKGSKVAFRVSTPRGGMPISVFDEKLNEDITWSTDGESLYFGRKLI
jgi:hypothetical protein